MIDKIIATMTNHRNDNNKQHTNNILPAIWEMDFESQNGLY